MAERDKRPATECDLCKEIGENLMISTLSGRFPGANLSHKSPSLLLDSIWDWIRYKTGECRTGFVNVCHRRENSQAMNGITKLSKDDGTLSLYYGGEVSEI